MVDSVQMPEIPPPPEIDPFFAKNMPFLDHIYLRYLILLFSVLGQDFLLFKDCPDPHGGRVAFGFAISGAKHGTGGGGRTE